VTVRARSVAVAIAIAGLPLLVPHVAVAEPYVVVAPEVLVAFPSDVELGLGGSATLGWGLDLEPLFVAPELSLSAHVLPSGPASLVRALAGARVGVAAFVEPSVYARVGAGMADADGAPSASGGIAIDAGAALDTRLSRDVTLGGQVGYAGLAELGGSAGSLHGLVLGGRLGVWF
jgi:hypothetical protein